ncbi:hypothetical protein F2Q70_00028653 [Brassica cretica]|uniref:Uncharacterized protein n=1 Tax=Brassica cretica TaxID=69181 RepID=A0A8S9LAX5_BRACR|nr:hypothetical protein F2Q70_00028653 [Brassica cretica]
MSRQPNRDKTVEKKNATSHHMSDRQTIRRHASRPQPSSSLERLHQSSAIGRDKSVKNHPSREPSQKQNAIESSIHKRYNIKEGFRRGRSRVSGKEKNLNRQSNCAGKNGANGAAESRRQKPAKRVLWKPPLPRNKSRTIIGGTEAKPEAKLVGNPETGNQKHQTLSSS